MAIQLPNPGLGDGQTGDNEFVMWTKVKDNFSNTTHAASRLVGTGAGQIPQAQDIYTVTGSIINVKNAGESDVDTFEAGTKNSIHQIATNGPPVSFRAGSDQWLVDTFSVLYFSSNSGRFQMAYGRGGNKAIAFRNQQGGSYTQWVNIYTTANTTKDVATGFLKASSPVLHVYNDKITKIHEAEQLDITVDKKGTGHYEIHGTTGLRKNDGWFMSPPRDMHSNILCMVDYEEKDGVIILKTYKKKFDFETVSIVHDYDNPMDIPEGSCVEFRFNDLPEQLDEPIE